MANAGGPTTLTVDARMFDSSGIGVYLHNLLPRVIVARPNMQFVVLGNSDFLGQHEWMHRDNVALVDCRAPIYSVAEQYEVYRLVPRTADLLWSPHYNIPLLYRGRLLVSVHDVCHIAMPQYVKGLHRRMYARWMFKALRRKASLIMCVSQFTADEALRLGVGIENKMAIIHNGVDATWSEIVRKKSPCDSPYIIYVGNIKPHKNVARLIQAFASVASRIPHKLIMVGKKDGFITGDEVVRECAAKLGDRVQFTDEVTDATLHQYVVNAEALVLPSLYEGFGLPPLEAMSCGCPCLVSHAASLPEICGDAAVYCDPYDIQDIAHNLEAILTNQRLRAQLVALGYERIKQFTWERSAAQLLDVVDTLIGS